MREFFVLLCVAISFQMLMVNSLAEDDLPAVFLTEFENDRHRQEHDVEEVIRLAYRLAEVGAGYESARVLASIALWERDRHSKNEATQLLTEWGLTINTIRQGNAQEIIEKVENVMRYRRGSNTQLRRVRNLIALGLYVDGARLLRQDIIKKSDSMIEQTWGENASNDLVNVLQTAHQKKQLRIQIRLLRAIDPEASEMAENLIWHLTPRKSKENNRDGKWDEDKYIPSVEELAPLVIHRAINLAKKSKSSSRLLAKLVIEASPQSQAAEKAFSLIKKFIFIL